MESGKKGRKNCVPFYNSNRTMPAFSVRFHRYLLPELTSIITNNPQRLVRFLAKDGKTYYGDAILPSGVSDIAKTKQARVIKGDIFGKHDLTEQIAVRDIRANGIASGKPWLSFVGCEITAGAAGKRRCENCEVLGTQL